MEKFFVQTSYALESVQTPREEHLPTASSSREQSVRVRTKKRRYNETYLELGFTHVNVNEEDRPQCVLCQVVLSSESMKPNKLRRHLQTHHLEHVGKPREFFKFHLDGLASQTKEFKKKMTISNQALRASFEVSYRIAQCKKPHTIAESLILPAAIDMVRIMCGDAEADKLKNIPLSNSTVKRRIEAIVTYQKKTLVEHLQQTHAYALQVDVSTDGRNAHIMTYVRYVGKAHIEEDFLFCLPLPDQENGEAMFQVLQNFLQENEIPTDTLVGLCTDGAPSMSGCQGLFHSLVKNMAPSVVWTHCLINLEQLASKPLSSELHEVMQVVVAAVNLIKNHPLRARLFAKIRQDMGAEHDETLYHTQMQWLSRGKALQCFFELRTEIYAYFVSCGNQKFAHFFRDGHQMSLLSYLSDMFQKLNDLNASLQGKDTHILILSDRINGFLRKLALWKTCVEEGKFECFPSLSSFLSENSAVQPSTGTIVAHLSSIENSFKSYFPGINLDQLDWIRNPFHSCPEKTDLPVGEVEQLIDLSEDRTHLASFSNLSTSEFWLSIREEYKKLSHRALKWLVLFTTSYQCESGFSAAVATKSSCRSSLDLSKELRCVLSSTKPDFDRLCGEAQGQVSHKRKQPSKMSLGPFLRTPFTDVTGPMMTSQTFGKCADFEMRFIECLEAYGGYRARVKCQDVYEDFRECTMRHKQRTRAAAMRLERHRQWWSGERKDHYEPGPPLDSY